ncbi:MAG: hypothetical protein RIC89_22185, partial [Pseudomonadales bacterium]
FRSHGEIHGETKFDAPWKKLEELLQYRWGDLLIYRAMVDSGFNPSKSVSGVSEDPRSPNKVYDFCRRFRGRVLPAKSWATRAKPISHAQIDISVNGRKVPNGLTLYHLDSDFFKSWVYDHLEMEPDDPGRIRLPEDASDDYCRQLVSEVRTVKKSGKVEWIRLRDNHYLDCLALNAALAHLLNLNLLSEATHDKYRGGADRKTDLAELARSLNG